MLAKEGKLCRWGDETEGAETTGNITRTSDLGTGRKGVRDFPSLIDYYYTTGIILFLSVARLHLCISSLFSPL